MRKIMIAGANSGCGKTTVTCAVLQAMANRKLNVSSFKCGPDYIDPMFHSEIIGAPSRNLDSFLMDDDTIRYLLQKNSGDINVIEGVMGFYDGLAFTDKGSSYEISEITDANVVLVVNCKGASLSALAVVKGFADFRKNNIKGVIFNNLPERLYEEMAWECRKTGIEPLGFLPRIDEARLESRRLGLVTAGEIADIKRKINILADYARRYINIDRLIQIASAGDAKIKIPEIKKTSSVRIAVARDRAFCFYYEDNLDLLREMGADLVEFSPLKNESVPECDGIILGGGYPELYAGTLEKNANTIKSIQTAIENGVPCIAECGGFMYLHETINTGGRRYKTVGIIKGECYKTDSLKRFGYMEMTAKRDNILCAAGEKIRAREFHYFESDSPGDGFTAEKNGRTWECVHTEGNLFAGFAHIHFYANTAFAQNFIKKCEEYKCIK